MMRKSLKWINIIYVWVFLLYYTATELLPVLLFIIKPGWIQISVSMLYTGLAIIILNIIVDRHRAFGKNIIWIILLAASFALTAAVRSRYNDNIYQNRMTLFHYIIQPFLLYAAGRQMVLREKKRFVFAWYTTVSAIFIPALCHMFYQFFALEHYLEADVNQGWFEGRLFGVMKILYCGTITVGVLAFFAGYYLYHSKSRIMKVIYSIELVIYLLYLALSDTRTVYLGCVAGIGFMIYQACYRKYGMDTDRRNGRWLIRGSGIFLITALLMFSGIKGIRKAALYSNWRIHGETAATEDSFYEFEEAEERPPQSFSSRRTSIWKSYLRILTDNPSNFIFGTSFYGKAIYIREHYPDEYIVSSFDLFYPQMGQAGSVYSEHNAYLAVWVRAGLLGLIGLIGFLLSCAADVLKRIRAGTFSSFECLLMSVICALVTAALFEEDICFRVSASSCFFWVFAGFLMNARDRSLKQ